MRSLSKPPGGSYCSRRTGVTAVVVSSDSINSGCHSSGSSAVVVVVHTNDSCC
jgi:hypothetical protein